MYTNAFINGNGNKIIDAKLNINDRLIISNTLLTSCKFSQSTNDEIENLYLYNSTIETDGSEYAIASSLSNSSLKNIKIYTTFNSSSNIGENYSFVVGSLENSVVSNMYLTLKGNCKNSSLDALFFVECSQSLLKNINYSFENFNGSYYIIQTNSNNFGVIVGFADNSVIKDIDIEQDRVNGNDVMTALKLTTTSKYNSIGIVAGIASNCEFTNITLGKQQANVTIKTDGSFEFSNTSSNKVATLYVVVDSEFGYNDYNNENYIGCLMGNVSNSNVSNCTLNNNLFVEYKNNYARNFDTYNHTYVGGVFGSIDLNTYKEIKNITRNPGAIRAITYEEDFNTKDSIKKFYNYDKAEWSLSHSSLDSKKNTNYKLRYSFYAAFDYNALKLVPNSTKSGYLYNYVGGFAGIIQSDAINFGSRQEVMSTVNSYKKSQIKCYIPLVIDDTLNNNNLDNIELELAIMDKSNMSYLSQENKVGYTSPFGIYSGLYNNGNYSNGTVAYSENNNTIVYCFGHNFVPFEMTEYILEYQSSGYYKLDADIYKQYILNWQ